jgi:hypothetical protein
VPADAFDLDVALPLLVVFAMTPVGHPGGRFWHAAVPKLSTTASQSQAE